MSDFPKLGRMVYVVKNRVLEFLLLRSEFVNLCVFLCALWDAPFSEAFHWPEIRWSVPMHPGRFCGHFLWTLFCGHFLWTLFVDTFVNTFCGHLCEYFLWTPLWTLFVNTFCWPLLWTIFRCNRLDGCVSRNRIFTHSLTPWLTHWLTEGSKLFAWNTGRNGWTGRKHKEGQRDNGTKG